MSLSLAKGKTRMDKSVDIIVCYSVRTVLYKTTGRKYLQVRLRVLTISNQTARSRILILLSVLSRWEQQ